MTGWRLTAQPFKARTRVGSWARKARDCESYDRVEGEAGGGQSIGEMEKGLFAVLAVGPEAEIDKAGYAKAVRLAKQRFKRLEKAREKE